MAGTANSISKSPVRRGRRGEGSVYPLYCPKDAGILKQRMRSCPACDPKANPPRPCAKHFKALEIDRCNDCRWGASISVTSNGKRQRVVREAPTEREAKLKLRQVQEEKANG